MTHDSGTGSQHTQHQDPKTEATKGIQPSFISVFTLLLLFPTFIFQYCLLGSDRRIMCKWVKREKSLLIYQLFNGRSVLGPIVNLKLSHAETPPCHPPAVQLDLVTWETGAHTCCRLWFKRGLTYSVCHQSMTGDYCPFSQKTKRLVWKSSLSVQQEDIFPPFGLIFCFT